VRCQRRPGDEHDGPWKRAGGRRAFFDSDTNLAPSDQFDLLGGNDRGAGTAVISTTSAEMTTLVYALEASPAFPGEAVCALRAVTLSG